MLKELSSLSDNISIEETSSLKSVLALLHGKRDSVTKVYYQPVIIELNNLCILNKQINDKLFNNDVSAIVTSIDVTTKKGKTISFPSWDDFELYRWEHESELINNIILKWDFFIKFPSYLTPQRHTISVKLASEPSPKDILSAMLADSLNDLEESETSFALTICRVDFINNILADEIINIVTKWIDLCEKSESDKKLYKALRKHASLFAYLFDISIMIGISLMGLILLHLLFDKNELITLTSIISLFIITLCMGYASSKICRYAGLNMIDAINNTGTYHMFLISCGDKKKDKELKRKRDNKSTWMWFILGIFIDIILGVIFSFLV